MVKALAAETYCLNSTERPIDYGHCKEIMADKYGEERAERMYESMMELPSARYFQVATKILLEKRAMMQLLKKTGRLEDFTYEALYDEWQATGRPVK
jgi:hypothetical protein